MSLSRILEALAEQGATPAMLVAAVRASEAGEQERLAVKRAKDAERQRRRRAKQEDVTLGHAESRGHDATPQDNADTPFLSPQVSPRPPSSPTNLSPEPPIVPHRRLKKAKPTKGPPEFEALWKAYPHVEGRSSKADALEVWESLDGETKALLPGAVARFRRAVGEACGGKGAPCMGRWLRDGKFAGLMPAEPVVEAKPWPGPSDFRAEAIAMTNEDFVRSWLDPCGWLNGADRVILTRNGFAADRLNRDLRGLLAKHNIGVRLDRQSPPREAA